MAGHLGRTPHRRVIAPQLPYRAEPGNTLLPESHLFGVAYFTIDTAANSKRKDGDPVTDLYDVAYLDSLPAIYESDFLRIVTFDAPLIIGINGLKGTGVVVKPETNTL